MRSFLTFEVEDEAAVDSRTVRAAQQGGTVRKQPSRTYYGACQSVVLDPEGHAFRINRLKIAERDG